MDWEEQEIESRYQIHKVLLQDFMNLCYNTELSNIFCRRFTFVELKANECLGMLDNLPVSEGISKSEIIAKMTALNEEIEKISGLSSAYHIGGSYFAKLSKYSDK